MTLFKQYNHLAGQHLLLTISNAIISHFLIHYMLGHVVALLPYNYFMCLTVKELVDHLLIHCLSVGYLVTFVQCLIRNPMESYVVLMF